MFDLGFLRLILFYLSAELTFIMPSFSSRVFKLHFHNTLHAELKVFAKLSSESVKKKSGLLLTQRHFKLIGNEVVRRYLGSLAVLVVSADSLVVLAVL